MHDVFSSGAINNFNFNIDIHESLKTKPNTFSKLI